jgi:peptide/nickel transport system permease protein
VLNTTVLALAGLALALLVALPLGAIAASYRSRWLDSALSFVSSLSLSLPSFLLALLAVLLAAKTGWFPIGGVHSLDYETFAVGHKLSDFLHHLILPATVLAVRQAPSYLRQAQAGMLEVLSQDYILTARAKGLGTRSIVFKHAFRNAAGPIISMFGNSAGSLLSGAFVIEVIMSWPGLGSLAVSSLLSRDLYALIACLIYAALLLVLGNLLGDLLLAAADPRLRRSQQA